MLKELSEVILSHVQQLFPNIIINSNLNNIIIDSNLNKIPYVIAWTRETERRDLKTRYVEYSIVIKEDEVIYNICGVMIKIYEICDPEFPNNLFKELNGFELEHEHRIIDVNTLIFYGWDIGAINIQLMTDL